MTIRILDPVGEVERPEKCTEQPLEHVERKRIGYIFNQHTSALAFWKAFETEVGQKLSPVSTHRLYKTNTWAQAPASEIQKLIEETDFALIGVGA
jgi:hypothetical protein